MASIAKRDGMWRAQLATLGVRESKTFNTKAEAAAWAAKRETEIREGVALGIQKSKTLDDAFRRYEKEVSIHKRGHRQEILRMNAIGRTVIDGIALQDMKLVDITSNVLGKWRDYRLNVDKVLGSSVNRDLNLLSHVFAAAMKEWKWIAISPTTDVRRPADPPPRDRLYSDDEIERICLALGFDQAQPELAATGYQRTAIAFLFAIETAMRAGEICRLTAGDIIGRTATLQQTKNGTKRAVPLSRRALELLALLPEVPAGETVFALSGPSLDALFRKAKLRAMVEDGTFHDTRHLAITRLAKKLNVLDLARMVGHKDLRQLQVYYNESAETMAARLD
ncbi:site-specific integrase [Massilia sp. YIM B02443]|uniref:tyrosine-type recombinase/integrase n=1 Tax=Massilia sp. YIM B02443 TaxID=3050127 RepID=UPI0025B6AACE|nr:site-specific integrase [Massilia sp. YIM B02443]MDN4036812.1 site-specific integrase [Massilia sp. YIM B02443]